MRIGAVVVVGVAWLASAPESVTAQAAVAASAQKVGERHEVRVVAVRTASEWSMFPGMPGTPTMKPKSGEVLVIVEFAAKDLRSGKDDSNASFSETGRPKLREADLQMVLTTTLQKEIWTRGEIRSISYEKGRKTSSIAIHFTSGESREFRLDSNFGHPITSMGGDFPYTANFAAAVEEFNRLAASAAESK